MDHHVWIPVLGHFFLIYELHFLQINPSTLNKRFKICVKSFLVYYRAKDSLKSAKNVIFWSAGQWGGGATSLWLRYWLKSIG